MLESTMCSERENHTNKVVEDVQSDMLSLMNEKLHEVEVKLELQLAEEQKRLQVTINKQLKLEEEVVKHEEKFQEDDQADGEVRIDPETGKVIVPTAVDAMNSAVKGKEMSVAGLTTT